MPTKSKPYHSIEMPAAPLQQRGEPGSQRDESPSAPVVPNGAAIRLKPVETFWLQADPLTGEPFDIPQGGSDAYQAAA